MRRLESGGRLVEQLERVLDARAALEQHIGLLYAEWAADAAKQLLETGL